MHDLLLMYKIMECQPFCTEIRQCHMNRTILTYMMQHIEGGTFAAVGFLDLDENIQKIIKKTRILDPFSIVKFELP